MLLADPQLESRGPGAEFARAYARQGDGATLRLAASLTAMFPPAQRRPRYIVRDLLKVAHVDEDRITYAREVATFDGSPDEVRGAGDAPEAGFRAFAVEAEVHPITARAPIPAEILGDPAALAAFVDYRLIVRLCTAENDALLNGDGDGAIRGLLNTEGLRDQEPRATVAETLLAAAATCEWYGGSADGVVVNPADWWPLVGQGGFLASLADAGVRFDRTRMVPPGFALVGDFHAAATVLDRRDATIRLVRGPEGPALEGEIREGLAVHLPGHFVRVRLPR